MKLTDLNPAGGIGANCTLVEIGPFRLVLDAGIHPKKSGRESLPDFRPIDGGGVDYVILTHCHLDHLGALPVLLREQPATPVLTSLPSQTLATRMLHNSVSVMTRMREEQGLVEYPFYTHGEVERLRHRLLPMPFHRSKTLDKAGEELEITFFPAGHVPGAAGVRLVHKHRRLFFTGDCLFSALRTVPQASFPHEPLDTLVLETTRGATERTPETAREREIERLAETLGHVLGAGGSVLLPVFAFGRMQEILTLLLEARQRGKIPHCPVYASGLGLELADQFDELTRKTSLVHFRRTILKELGVRKLPDTLRPGRDPGGPALYVLSSGMMTEKTSSWKVAASLLPFHRHAVCFVGYCDPDTPGGRILRSQPGEEILFPGLDFSARRQARLEKFDLSSHADREELLEFAVRASPRAVVLSHGDPPARAWFQQALGELSPATFVLDPIPGRTYQV